MTLKSQYTAIALAYVEAFAEKHCQNVEFDENHLDFFFFFNTFVSYDDIRTDIDQDAPPEAYGDYLSQQQRSVIKTNYKSYLMGYRQP